MKKLLITFFLIFLSSLFSYSQLNNIVGNPGFEELEGNFNDILDDNGRAYACWGPEIAGFASGTTNRVQIYWSRITQWEVPDNGFPCNGLPTPDIDGGGINSSLAHSGNFYGGCGEGEYFCQQFESTMLNNHEYYIQYYGIGSSKNAGLCFSNLKPRICDPIIGDGSVKVTIDGVPVNNSQFPSNNQYQGGEWSKIYGYFYPSGNKNWMTVGAFGSKNASNQTSLSLRVDDFQIYDLGDNQGCVADRVFENTSFDDLNILFRASNSIKAGNDLVPNNGITGPVTVENNSNITFRAGNEIALLDGFSALPASNFSAYISPCECNPIESNAGENFSLCGVGQTHSMGMSSVPNASAYQWVSDPPEAINYLSDPTIPNPIFIGPENPITPLFYYTLNVIGQCVNQVSSSSITVNYSDQMPATNSTFTNLIATYNPSERKIEISALTGEKTLEVKIEIYTGSTLLNTYTLHREDAFVTGAIDYIPSHTFSDCMDYTIKISGRSVCYDNFGDIFEYYLNLPNPPSLNLISPNPQNLSNLWVQEGSTSFCITTEGAESITLEIIAGNNGNTLFSTSVFTSVTSHETCIWNCSDGNLNDGWYPFILTINGCNNETQEFLGSFQYNNASNKLEETDSSSNENTFTPYYFLHPNPNTGRFSLTQTPDYIKKWQLSSIMGQVLLSGTIPQGSTQNEIDISNLTKGIYIFQFESTDGFKVEQVIFQ